MPRALVARSERWAVSIAQPATRRLNTSVTSAAVGLALPGGCPVMPVTYSRFGPSAVNWRLTRPVTVFWADTRLARRRGGSPEIPGRRISSITVL
jgi:hypothetical protein